MADPAERKRAPADEEQESSAAPAPGPDVARPTPPPHHRREPAGLHRRLLRYVGDILAGVWKKAEQDNIFFLAGAISFNVLVAFIPLVLAVLGIAGAVLRVQGANAQAQLMRYISEAVPAAVNVDVAPILEELAQQSTGILSVGTLFFLWVATRLVGTLRTVLREIFDIAEGRNIISGKIFDIKMVFAAGTLFALNVALTLGLRLAAGFTAEFLDLDPASVPFLSQTTELWPQLVAFITLWVMFFLIYRYLPPRRIRWSTATIAATFTALLVEVLKYGFTFYLSRFANLSAWGSVATFVVLVLWIYYTSVVFILGGEVAQVVAMRRIRRRQRERLA
jgi:membrane protein